MPERLEARKKQGLDNTSRQCLSWPSKFRDSLFLFDDGKTEQGEKHHFVQESHGTSSMGDRKVFAFGRFLAKELDNHLTHRQRGDRQKMPLVAEHLVSGDIQLQKYLVHENRGGNRQSTPPIHEFGSGENPEKVQPDKTAATHRKNNESPSP
ncbi:hypothetical protein [Sulfidibacter corallicola]|uniref:Uncharacterized protein n=1 Tax=Sulfidibacter corallicola TaxID=2818388 RepID=A0A8A4TNA5_SULCO|nr:hypothetical protein [Sulfidibacter corallicola]QTD50582.1 hypothetical protein J3U87_33780 [Sulfidibacter corallicola]